VVFRGRRGFHPPLDSQELPTSGQGESADLHVVFFEPGLLEDRIHDAYPVVADQILGRMFQHRTEDIAVVRTGVPGILSGTALKDRWP